MSSEDVEACLLDEFKHKEQLYRELDGIIYSRLAAMVQEEHFFVMDIAHRVKDIDSLKGKLKKKKGKYHALTDITDLCGARIICYFSKTVDDIATALKKRFCLDVENSIDKRRSLQATQFGYLSLHCILSLKPEDGYSKELCDIRFEIQIRTVLQHAWAEIEHDLGYKSAFGVPRPIRREFSRVAGLLELADEQFVNIRRDVAEYEQHVRELIKSGDCDSLPLDEVTLTEFVEFNKQFEYQTNKICKYLGVMYLPNPVERYLKRLAWLDIDTLGDFLKLYKANISDINKMLTIVIQDFDFDFISTTMILDQFCYVVLKNHNYSREQMYKFISLENYNEKSAWQKVDRLIEQFEIL